MLSLSRFDLTAAAFFIIGCCLLFSIRYIGRGAYHGGKRTNPQPTHNERDTDE